MHTAKPPADNDSQPPETRTLYLVWDRTTRWFHWINFLCILILSAVGTIILFGDELGVTNSGEILLKTIHVYAGYIFAINLGWRLVWAFIGTPYAKWRAILPFRGGFISSALTYIKGLRSGTSPVYRGRDPLARVMVTILLGLLTFQAASGLVLAGTDLYKPPFGFIMARWATASDEEKLARLEAGSKEFIDQNGYAEMRAFRKPIKESHEMAFYILLAMIVVHVSGAVVSEVRLKQGHISGMFNGRKALPEAPHDDP